jgi:hypothetical protein
MCLAYKTRKGTEMAEAIQKAHAFPLAISGFPQSFCLLPRALKIWVHSLYGFETRKMVVNEPVAQGCHEESDFVLSLLFSFTIILN